MKDIIYVVVVYSCGDWDLYNMRSFKQKEDAIIYAYEAIKEDSALWENFTDEEIKDISFKQWVIDILQEEGEIEVTVKILSMLIE